VNGGLGELTQWLAPRLGPVLAAGAVAWVVLAVLLWRLTGAMRRLETHYRRLAGGVHEGNLEALLTEQMSRLELAVGQTEALGEALEALGRQTEQCLQHVGVVRYDAFSGVGGQVSFSLALLDARGDGIILTSLFGRETSSIYAKPVSGGRCGVPLTDEEQQALTEAGGAVSARRRVV
jgi:hypothetical protein